MTILNAENLYKTYGDKTLFDHISFSITDRERIGLIGVNGTGKSTLLKVIAGLENAEAGTMDHAKSFHVEYLPQHPVFEKEKPVLDAIYDGNTPVMQVLRAYEKSLAELEADPDNESKQTTFFAMEQKMTEQDAWEAGTTAKTVLTQLGITHFRQSVTQLSGGQQKKVALARALIQPADLLIFDEPTNHLDHETILWLEEYLPQYHGAVLLVTHDRYFLNRITSEIWELDQGRLYFYEGNYETFLQKKAEREEKEAADEQKRQNLLRSELAWLRRGVKARGTKQKARKQRVETLQNQPKSAPKESIDISVGSKRLGKQVLEAKDLTKTYDGKTPIDHFNYLVTPGERIGIIGPNGIGKTTLLDLFASYKQPDEGTIDIGATVKIGYYTQNHESLDGNLRVIEYIREEAEVMHTAEGEEITAAQMLERFLFSRAAQWNYIRKLSGGEQKRLYLLRILMSEPNVLLLDEPTNDLDTETLTILEDYLDHFPGVVIAASHDRYFLDRVADRLIAFEDDSIRRFEGNYSEYIEEQKHEKAQKPRKEIEKPKKPAQKDRPRKLTYREQQEWDSIEDRITELEKQVEAIKQEIENAGSDLERVQELYQQQQEAEQTLDAAMERWTELSELMEEIEESK